MAIKFASETVKSKFAEALLKVIAGTRNGSEAVSYAQTEMRAAGFKNIGCLADFESLCEEAGFSIRQGKNDRGQSCREVYL